MTEEKERVSGGKPAPEEKKKESGGSPAAEMKEGETNGSPVPEERAKQGGGRMLKKRLLCFLFVTFALTWIPTFLFLGLGGKYVSDQPETDLLCAFSMLCPAAAVLITRKLTGEGFAVTGRDSLLLGIRFTDRRWSWYLMAFGFPLLYQGISGILWFLLAPESFDPSMLERIGVSPLIFLYVPINGAISAVAFSFGALGEELGWRTYLYPKLEELFGLRKALLLGGLIWSVWHFPLVAVGHIGTGYWGEPYTGFLLFTVDTVFMGCIAYLLVKKTGSVWPAVFLHAFHNAMGGGVMMFFLNEEKITGIFRDRAAQLAVTAVGTCVVGVFACCLLRRAKTEVQDL